MAFGAIPKPGSTGTTLGAGVKARDPETLRRLMSGEISESDSYRGGGSAAPGAAFNMTRGIQQGMQTIANAARGGQTNGNALYGNFFNGGSMAAPNVQAPAAPKPTSGQSTLIKPKKPGGGLDLRGIGDPFAPPPPLQAPGQNMTNPGYGEQALEYTQNRLLNDPTQGMLQGNYNATQGQSQGEQYLNQNMGSLNGPGTGEQYWNQVQGQFMDPFSGEQYARQATQNFAAQGPSSAFNNQVMGDHYGSYTNYNTGNAQGQYGMSAGQLANGTAGENNLGQIAGGYSQHGEYNGPNLAAGQYAQTQQAFGDLPIANFDPFYDRARQLGVQDYNRQAAGRGVYGSSEALSGVGNVITDIEAQRANRSFDAEMQRAQEQRARQELLGNQARQGDLSSLGAFGANLQGAQTYGQLANMQGQLELQRHDTLGSLANNADTQATAAQNARTNALQAFGTIANNADTNETNRYEATTSAMNNADKTQLDRLSTGADVAFRGQDAAREDFRASNQAAESAARLGLDRNMQGANIAAQMSQQDLQRLQAFNNQAQGAENQRQNRVQSEINATSDYSNDVQQALSSALEGVIGGDQQMTEQKWQMEILPLLQAMNMDQQQQQNLYNVLFKGMEMAGGQG